MSSLDQTVYLVEAATTLARLEAEESRKTVVATDGSNSAGVRPEVLSRETLQGLNDLCGFRHVVRNGYTFDLIPDRVEALANQLPDCLAKLQPDL